MLFQKELLEALAETLEGLILPSASNDASGQTHPGGTTGSENSATSILVFHPRDKKSAKTSGVGSATPLLEIDLSESEDEAVAIVHSALGMLELRDIEEVRLSASTEEAALFLHTGSDAVTVVTISSHGVLQVYANIPRSVTAKELNDLAEEDLRAAVALKIFSEGARVFRSEVRAN